MFRIYNFTHCLNQKSSFAKSSTCLISGDSRQKEKKMAKTRSKVKSSDEDGSPKSAQKKVKLLQPYVFVNLLPILCYFIFFILTILFLSSSEESSTVLLAILGMCTHLMYWTCQLTPTNPLIACAIRSHTAR